MIRLIPACAGTTGYIGVAQELIPAHPRVRGDHTQSRKNDKRVNGSSPRARGPPAIDSSLSPDARLIPACAGTTRVGHGYM